MPYLYPAPSDHTYGSHRRWVSAISGVTAKGVPFVTTVKTRILENRVNGVVRSVTVLDSNGGPFAKAVVRLTGASARY